LHPVVHFDKPVKIIPAFSPAFGQGFGLGNHPIQAPEFFLILIGIAFCGQDDFSLKAAAVHAFQDGFAQGVDGFETLAGKDDPALAPDDFVSCILQGSKGLPIGESWPVLGGLFEGEFDMNKKPPHPFFFQDIASDGFGMMGGFLPDRPFLLKSLVGQKMDA
jgi:hypothetical protein